MRRYLVLLSALWLAGCGADTPSPGPLGPLRVEDMGPATKAQSERALEARDELKLALGGRLLNAITSDGAAAAVAVCKEAAPEITATISAQAGVKIGRTAFRLRNTENAPPAWAEAAIRARAQEPTWVGLEGGALGGLFPIHIQPLCTKCHGPDDVVSPEVKSALAKAYPGDRATGFAIGDLRGWFWVEVPAAP